MVEETKGTGEAYQSQKYSPNSTTNNPDDCRNWYEMRFKDQQPDRRSYHSSFIFDRKLYVYGGLDIRDGSLSSLYELNLNCLNELTEEEPEI